MKDYPARSIPVGRSVILGLALGILFPVSGETEESSLKLNLTCSGNGSVSHTKTTTIRQYDSKTHSSSIATAQSPDKRPFSGTAQVELSGAFGRVRLPKDMVPPINNANEEGWFVINELFVNEREITGALRINALNQPKVRIDRTSGMITIGSGLSDFAGQCDAVAKDAPRRF